MLPNDNLNTESAITPMILSRLTCVIIFAVLTLSIIISALVESTLLASLCTTASMNLHNNMFNSITRATMHFLNTNSSGKKKIIFYDIILIAIIYQILGRILNRFSKDIGIIDEMLPSIFIEVIQVKYLL